MRIAMSRVLKADGEVDGTIVIMAQAFATLPFRVADTVRFDTPLTFSAVKTTETPVETRM
jgi:hypothetical protein